MSPGNRFVEKLVQHHLEEQGLRGLARASQLPGTDGALLAVRTFQETVRRLPTMAELEALQTDPAWREDLIRVTLALRFEETADARRYVPEFVGGYRDAPVAVKIPRPSWRDVLRSALSWLRYAVPFLLANRRRAKETP